MLCAFFVVALMATSMIPTEAQLSTPTDSHPGIGQTDNDDVADVTITPGNRPTVDGNLSTVEGEWDDAVSYSIPLGNTGINGTMLFKTNETMMYVAFHFKLHNSSYSPVNGTVPANETYNPANHTFFALAFDRNFDERKGGSVCSPDDLVLFDYRYPSALDAYSTGTENKSLVFDDLDHVEDAVIRDYNITIGMYNITWEFSKPLDSGDDQGHDVNLASGMLIPFTLYWFEYDTACFTLSNDTVDWHILMFERGDHGLLELREPTDTSVLLLCGDTLGTARVNFSSIETFLTKYGFEVTTPNIYEPVTSGQLTDADIILVVGGSNAITDDQLAVSLFDELGGGKPIFLALDPQSTDSAVSKELDKMGITLNDSLLRQEIPAVNGSEGSFIVQGSQITEESLLHNESVMIGATAEELLYTGSYFDFNGTQGRSEEFLSQRTDFYAIFNGSYRLFVDANDNLTREDDERLSGFPYLGFAIEGQRGGRLAAVASADMFNSSMLAEKDNAVFLLNTIQWLLGVSRATNITSFDAPSGSFETDEEIVLEAAVDNCNGSVLEGLTVSAVLTITHDEYQVVRMITTDGMNFTVTVKLSKAAFTEIRIEASLRGFGFSQSEIKYVTVETPARELGELNWLMFLLLLISLGGSVFVTMALLASRSESSLVIQPADDKVKTAKKTKTKTKTKSKSKAKGKTKKSKKKKASKASAVETTTEEPVVEEPSTEETET